MKLFKSIKKGFGFLLRGTKHLFKWKHWKNTLDTVVALSTVATLIVVLLTLNEMQIQRDKAYIPFIIVEDTQVHIEWDGTESDDGAVPAGENPLVEDGDKVNPMTVPINARNIGVGVAKQIHITVNMEELLYEMVDALNQNAHYVQPHYKLNEDGGTLYFLKGNDSIGSNKTIYFDKLYLLPNAEESFSIGIPPLFIIVVREFFIENSHDLLKNYPLVFNVSCQDIQGKDYTSQIKLFFELSFLTNGSDGSGYATYNIKSK